MSSEGTRRTNWKLLLSGRLRTYFAIKETVGLMENFKRLPHHEALRRGRRLEHGLNYAHLLLIDRKTLVHNVFSALGWCLGSDSNRHPFRERILSPSRLPITPPRQGVQRA